MTYERRTSPAHVSYIERSGNYYAAHGYDQRYQWASHDEAPFSPLLKPLSESKVGLVTTAYLGPEEVPFVAERSAATQLQTSRLSWAKDETNTDDPNSFLPYDRLDEFVAEGRVGAVSSRFYGAPTVYSHRLNQRRDAPQIHRWVAEDNVDVVLAVPL